MTSKIDKFLDRLNGKEFTQVMNMVEKITNLDLSGLDIKKLIGQKDIYRAKKGVIRIVYFVEDNKGKIISISRRSEKTYRDF